MSHTTASIRYVKDKNDEVFFPVAHEKGVVDSSGTTLETKLGLKQDTLVSGTSIKTINNESILGSGNISVQTSITTDAAPVSGSTNPVQSGGVYTALQDKQDLLESGANIKTINHQSLLGIGNIDVSGGAIPENCEVTDNKVTTISSTSTNIQYPSAKAVYDYVEGLESIIGDMDSLINHITEDSEEDSGEDEGSEE